MSGTSPAVEPQAVEERSRDYVRFIILSGARTGSNMLASSLNSSRNIICFRELFNWIVNFIDFNVEGYDRMSAEARTLRARDFKKFLQELIFCARPEEIRAVGFKMPYPHFSGFPGLLEFLVEDTEIRVLHLKRRNLLRALVSSRIARMTGRWGEDRKPTLASELGPTNALSAVRHPLRAAVRVRNLLWPREPPGKAPKAPVTLSEEECRASFMQVERDAAMYASRLSEHPMLTLYYEDLLRHRKDVLNRVQSFLGLQPRQLAVTMRRQNPEPLSGLVENYDELHAALKDTPYAAFFD